MKVLKAVEQDAAAADANANAPAKKVVTKATERDPLASTEEEETNVVVEKVNLKEIDRLLYHVRAIESDCHIIPQGSMKLNHKHEVQRNEAFNGLNNTEAFDLKNYSHFRNCLDATKKANLEADDAIFNKSFLDDVHTDLPKGCWSLQKDNTQTMAVIRNNVWRGFTAYHTVNTNEHGCIYVGDGLKNGNFCFMV